MFVVLGESPTWQGPCRDHEVSSLSRPETWTLRLLCTAEQRCTRRLWIIIMGPLGIAREQASPADGLPGLMTFYWWYKQRWSEKIEKVMLDMKSNRKVVQGVELCRPRAREVATSHGHAGTREVTPGRVKSHRKRSCTSRSPWPRAS